MIPIFDIPIYRLSPVQWEMEIEKEKNNRFNYFSSIDKNYRTKEKTDEQYDKIYRKPRRYNDIIGYVRVEVSGGGKVFGDYYLVKAKRIIKGGKKDFQYMGKFFETRFSISESNEEILERLISNLIETQKNSFKKRYLDLEFLENMGKYIDRKKVIFVTEVDNGEIRVEF